LLVLKTLFIHPKTVEIRCRRKKSRDMLQAKTEAFTLSHLFEDCYVMKDSLPEFKMLIDGSWQFSSGGRSLDVDSPIDDRVIARVQNATTDNVDKAVKAAHNARRKIRDIPAIDRIDILNRARHIIEEHREDFVNMLVLEAGKPVEMATGEVRAAVNRIKMTMEEARNIFGEYVPGDWSEDTMAKFALVIHEPVGVIACVSPFNYPLFSVVAKVIPALVSGNTVVAKPASDDPIVALLLGRVLQEAGMPDGVVNVITGSGREVGNHLVDHDLVNMVTLTGSTETGKQVAKLVGMKRMHLELGGKGSAIVASDADVSLAAKKVLEGSLKYSGQRCDAISRVLVEEVVAPKFLDRLLKEFEAWRVGDPRDSRYNLGPLINPKAAERVQSLVDDAVAKGAVLLRGGKHKGSYFEPTIVDSVPLNARIAWEETFGPVVVVIKVNNIDEAIDVSNKSRYGLDSCVFTNNFYTAWKVAKRLEEGSVSLNDAPSHGVGYFPFGGNKDSGLGREGIGYSIDEMTRIKTIQFNLAPAGLGKTRQLPKM
jgi:acyl-CoA reductase-like NAD-dependent aldehyde dehydrogenase